VIRLEPFELDAVELGRSIAITWTMALVAIGLLQWVFRGFFRDRKVQSQPFSRQVFLHELLFSALNVAVAGSAIGLLSSLFAQSGALTLAEGPAGLHAVVLEVGLYLFAFDLYFYVMHRLMHTDVLFRLVHAIHHRSTSPNPLTAFSFHPLEALLTGSFLPVFLVLVEVHSLSLGLITVVLGPVMSMLVHSGHEVFPSWWYRSSFTPWLAR